MSTNHIRRRWASLLQMRLLSVGSFLFSLSLLALLTLLQLVLHSAQGSMQEQVEIRAELYSGMGESQQAELLAQLGQKPYVIEPKILSADEALTEVITVLGEDPRDLLGHNPLTPLVHFRLSGGVVAEDSLRLVERELQEILPSISLEDRRMRAGEMSTIFARLQMGLWVAGGIALLFALIQISSTIQLTLRLEKRKIRTLSLVGASPWFIIRPIVGRALVDGLISWLLCLGAMWGLALYVQAAWSVELMRLLPWSTLLLASGAGLLFAVLLPSAVAYGECRKYLKMEEGHLILH